MAIERSNPPDHRKLSRGMRQWREAHNLSVADCAKLLGITERHVQLLESGQRRPSVDLLMRMHGVTKPGRHCAMGFQFCPQTCLPRPVPVPAPVLAQA